MCGRISVYMRHLLTLWDMVVFIAMYAVECGEGDESIVADPWL